MPWLSCYLNPLTLTCLGHEMAASCLTFLLCSNVTVSSYSFMVIADKKPQPWLYTPVDSRRPSAVAMSSVWHGLAVEVTFFCLLTVMGTNLQPSWLQDVGDRILVFGGLAFLLLRFSVAVFYDDECHNFLFPPLLRLIFQLFIFMISLIITFQHFQLLQ